MKRKADEPKQRAQSSPNLFSAEAGTPKALQQRGRVTLCAAEGQSVQRILGIQ